MSTGMETVEVVEPWLFQRLWGDAALRALVGDSIINTLAMGDVATPYVVFSLSSARDIAGTGAVRTQVDCIYNVKAVAAGASWTPVLTIAKRLEALLDTSLLGTQSIPAGDLTCTRETVIEYPELVDGTQYRHLGGAWRIRANGAG